MHIAGAAARRARAPCLSLTHSGCGPAQVERTGREKQLKGWMQDMEMQSQLAGKGKKKKIKNGKNGRLPSYKWATARKK